MDQITALTEDEVWVGAWAEVREPLELQLAPLGRHALVALAPRPGERVLDIGCGGGETALDLARAVAPDGMVVGADRSAAGWRSRDARPKGASECASSRQMPRCFHSNRPRSTPPFRGLG
jgi:cyclopropane fatty-acyl-phospholipid synthase-like methyltransferase